MCVCVRYCLDCTPSVHVIVPCLVACPVGDFCRSLVQTLYHASKVYKRETDPTTAEGRQKRQKLGKALPTIGRLIVDRKVGIVVMRLGIVYKVSLIYIGKYVFQRVESHNPLKEELERLYKPTRCSNSHGQSRISLRAASSTEATITSTGSTRRSSIPS